jgi:hypothetical protein
MDIKGAVDEVVKAMGDKTGELVFTVLVAAVSYAWSSAKSWFQQGSVRDKQTLLGLEAARLLKLRDTLATAKNATPAISNAQAVVEGELNQVLESLSHLVTEPSPLSSHSGSVAMAGKYLLLYRPVGFVSTLLHWAFYLLVLVWMLFVGVGFRIDTWGTALMVSAVLLVPVLIWNYLTRKIDEWLRRRHSVTPVLAKPGPAH